MDVQSIFEIWRTRVFEGSFFSDININQVLQLEQIEVLQVFEHYFMSPYRDASIHHSF